jgi:hypothetical protein
VAALEEREEVVVTEYEGTLLSLFSSLELFLVSLSPVSWNQNPIDDS